MSAIAGIYQFDQRPLDPDEGSRMMSALERFPADDAQTWQQDAVFIGCRSQWIVPESIGERLPFYDADRKLVIAADAIIDNREQLFRLLSIETYRRRSMTDSELILLAYEKWRDNAPKHLVGDFAFVIWDERRRRLFAARDFSGGRTLYYCMQGSRAAVCTLIQPLLALHGVTRELHEPWLAEYLAITGMIDTADTSSTVYRSIQQVPPSHYLTVDAQGLKLSQYEVLSSIPPLRLKSDEEYVEAFHEVFQEAVSSRLRTSREVGAQLSGGLDSGTIVSFAVRALRKDGRKTLHTLSYVPPRDFKDFTPRSEMADESPAIRSIVKHVGGISDRYLPFEGRSPLTEIEDFLDVMEMPYKFFENSFWLKGMFEEAHRLGVGVLLNGGRGNMSISWGSAIDYYALLLKRFRWIKLLRELPLYSERAGGARFRRIAELAGVAFPVIHKWRSSDAVYRLPSLINPDFALTTGVLGKLKTYGMDETGWFASSNVYEQRRRHFEDGFHWNASNTLSTKLSMRYSLWKRDPTNDLRVIRFCLSVPESQYVTGGMDRALVRRATDKLLPDDVRLNQRSRGVQGVDWVHRMLPEWGAFREELQRFKADKEVFRYLNFPTIENAIRKAEDGVSPDFIWDPSARVLMRGLIVYRFIRRLQEGR
ncbi:asparagine synthase-related protein [Cohnella soli]|uniref:asparagine synthase (glutamine-hydrolyzing) n=1 Tax=Cohnella soli TaxID=425005 RepID=A0ABW0I683_9BACL